MKIERVDEKTVKCFLSNEDLEEYQIDYKDFVMRSEKAKQVVYEIMEEATRQVGYKPPKFAFDMQIMMLPDEGLLLTFSEADSANLPNLEQIMSYIREMKKEAQNLAAQQAEASAEEGKPETAIFVFESIAEVMAYAASLPSNLRVKSALYENAGKYYLYMERGGASYKRYSRACICAMEFATLYGTEEKKLLPFREQGGCLIEEKALQKLRG